MWPFDAARQVTSYERIQAIRLQAYEAGLETRAFRPFVYPWDCLPALYLLLALLILPRISATYARVLRWPILFGILSHCAYVLRSCRTIGFAGGYGIGLSATWGCIMTLALLFFNDIKEDFVRLEARKSRGNITNSAGTGPAWFSDIQEDKKARHRYPRRQQSSSAPEASKRVPVKNSDEPYSLTWQKYPMSLLHCLDWVVDLLTAFRGTNFNFRDPTLTKLEHEAGDNNTLAPPVTINHVRQKALIAFARLYLILDTIQVIQSTDPYFSGQMALEDASPALIYAMSPFFVRITRLSISLLAVWAALNFIFQLCPLVFTTLPLLIPYPTLITITRTPFLTPSMYERYWGPFLPSLTEKGLGGFWGRFWHQFFRFGISQPSVYIIKTYNLNPRSNKARLIQVLTAFCFSGTIHAFASHTSFAPIPGSTDPITGAWAFFMLQGIGILLQAYTTRTIKSRSYPLPLRQAGNAAFVLIWLYFTGPMLANDFARCGVWLFEPIPISIVRAILGQKWWRWGGRWVGWWSDPDGNWWKSGLAVY